MNEDFYLQALNAFNNTLANNANVIMASQTSREDRKFSERMSDLAWERNKEAWKMQNDYNLPVNVYARQLEGLMANGLNPNLVYGNSSSVSGAAGSVSPYKFDGYHSTAVPRFGAIDSVGSILSTRLLQTQIAAQEANNRLINARADNEEARNPGIVAKSSEFSHRWSVISNRLIDNYDEAVKASLAKEYWTGVKSEYDAERAQDMRTLSHFEAVIAEYLNETYIPGMNMTYKQYMETCKAYLPGIQFERFKADIYNIASQIAYRTQQGEFLELRKEYQTYLNRLAKYGRSLGNDWVTLLISGIAEMFGEDPVSVVQGAINRAGQSQLNVPATYPGP